MPLLTTYRVRQADTPLALPVQVVDDDSGDAPYPLAGLVVTARMYPVAYFGQAHTMAPVIDNRPCAITDLAAGTVAMPWAPGDLDTPGRYELDVLLWQGGAHVGTVKSVLITVTAEA